MFITFEWEFLFVSRWSTIRKFTKFYLQTNHIQQVSGNWIVLIYITEQYFYCHTNEVSKIQDNFMHNQIKFWTNNSTLWLRPKLYINWTENTFQNWNTERMKKNSQPHQVTVHQWLIYCAAANMTSAWKRRLKALLVGGVALAPHTSRGPICFGSRQSPAGGNGTNAMTVQRLSFQLQTQIEECLDQ